VRYTLISGHYRQPLNFTLHSLDASRQALQKLARFEKGLKEQSGVTTTPTYADLLKHGTAGIFQPAWEALLDDLNVPGALGGIFTVVHKTKAPSLSVEEAKAALMDLHFILAALGLELPPVKEDEVVDAPEEVKALAEQRWTAKKAKDFISADDLRRQIEALGWMVKDTKDGYVLMPK
jgi:cysteinyl-tRNA synthetase